MRKKKKNCLCTTILVFVRINFLAVLLKLYRKINVAQILLKKILYATRKISQQGKIKILMKNTFCFSESLITEK